MAKSKTPTQVAGSRTQVAGSRTQVAGSRTQVAGSRSRLVAAAAELLSKQGFAGTGVQEIARTAGAPTGSFYFHFPGGKEELGVAALEQGAEDVATMFAAELDRHEHLGDALAACALTLADGLAATGWVSGCPVAATALETVERSPRLRAASGRAFDQWVATFQHRIGDAGVAEPAARQLATTTLALIEGAELMARVHGDPAPLVDAAGALRVLAGAAVAAAPA